MRAIDADGQLTRLGPAEELEVFDDGTLSSDEKIHHAIHMRGDVYERLKDEPLRLEIDYSLTLMRLSGAHALSALNGEQRIHGVGWCKTRMNDTGTAINLGCLEAGSTSHCGSVFLENAATGKRNPMISDCDPDYAPYFGSSFIYDAMGRFGTTLPFRDATGLSQYPVDGPQLPSELSPSNGQRNMFVMSNMEGLHLTPTERGELQSFLRKRNLPASVAQRMRIILSLDQGISYRELEELLGAFPSTISRWKQRFEKDGLLGLATVHPGQPPQKLTPQLRARVLEKTRQAPPDGSTHWSLRKMAAVMKVNKNLIARIWKEADLKPHRLERYMASNDPQFEEKAAAIIGLYLNPPQNAAVFCVDEKSAIQALDRLDRCLPLSPGRAEKHGFEYYRHGTLSLYAALNPRTGEVIGQTAARHTSQEFVTFLEDVVATQPAHREVHVILDNFSTHKTDLVKRYLAQHSNVTLHFTPTYSSWLNQVESWFSKLQRDVIDRGIFTSVSDLKRKILRYIRLYQKAAKPFQWKYCDVRKRIPAW